MRNEKESLKELTDFTNLMSSANIRNVEEKLILLGRSLTYKRKRKGPSTLPCGTGESTGG